MSVQSSEQNSEWLTRKRLVDAKLKAAGWNIVPFSPGKPSSNHTPCAIEEFETANGPAASQTSAKPDRKQTRPKAKLAMTKG
jgi:hypothetical protein